MFYLSEIINISGNFKHVHDIQTWISARVIKYGTVCVCIYFMDIIPMAILATQNYLQEKQRVIFKDHPLFNELKITTKR